MRYRIDMEILGLGAIMEGAVTFETRDAAQKEMDALRVNLLFCGIYGINLTIVEFE